MSTIIQIRDVPDDVCRKLEAQAARTGQSLSAYLLAEIQRLAERPSVEELRDRLHHRAPITPGVSPADAVREERDSR